MAKRTVKLADLVYYKKNAKQHPADQIEKIKRSIEKFGFRGGVQVTEGNVIVTGHGRVTALKKLGYSEIEVEVIEDLKPEDIQAYRLADNRTAESAWDIDLLREEFIDLKDQDYDLRNTGFDQTEIDKILDFEVSSPEDDDIPELPKEPKVKRGEVWLLGKHRLMCGDSLNRDEVSKLMDSATADMIFTDPPYGVDYEGKTKAKLKIKNDAMSEEDLSVFWESAYSLMREFLKDGGSVYVTVPPRPLHLIFVNALKKFGDLRQILVWIKNNFVLGRSDYHYQHEPILYGWKEGAKHTWYGGRTKNTAWQYDKPVRSDMHPTMKPVELICEAIKNSSSEHEIVIDFFGGSGSTLIACEKTNRFCYTMELDERYASVILQRWEEMTGQTAIKL